jgi:hypothetical protein
MEEEASMTNEEKAEKIRPWIDRAKGVKVQFRGEQGLDAIVTACSDVLVDLSIEPGGSFMRQTVYVPLSRIEISEAQGSDTQDPDRPLEGRRLMLYVDDTRPPVVL